MSKTHYKFDPSGPLVELDVHSLAKHDVLRSYLSAYFQTLARSHRQEELKLTLVDGFAGGGIYEHPLTKEPVLGSPFIFLNAAEEAEYLINKGRNKLLKMNIDYFFVEKNKKTYKLLRKTLNDEGYSDRIGSDIKVINGKFEEEFNSISSFIEDKNPRNGRAIFLLDQYGYTDVPVSQVHTILRKFPSSEVILTFNVDSFINFASDTSANDSLHKVGIPDALKGRTIEDIKNNERDFRLYIQSCLHKELVEKCGALYYTTFFIRSEGHGIFWLVHLSQHHRARDVMTSVHWSKNNRFIHYGGPGLDMYNVLGYDPKYDSKLFGQGEFRFCFDNPAQNASVTTLAEQIPHYIFARDEGILFGELFATTCNSSPADSSLYKTASVKLLEHKEIEILSPDGNRRLKESTIRDVDRLVRSKQKKLTF